MKKDLKLEWCCKKYCNCSS